MADPFPTQVPPAAGQSQPVGATSDNPFSPTEAAAAAVRGGANLYGAFSIETFCDQGSLSLTHDDAAGWLAYVEQFTPRNFWYGDSGVRVWAYYEDYDNWQDTYGMDAVLAVYHSGHGGMDANGVFYAPMGADWGGLGCTAISSNMRLGNEHVRYIFWSTCLSLRVLDGHNPIRTWQGANLGWRMLFGFETTSWDSADYGRNFWNHWKSGKSLSQAWLDGSWDIAHDQAPSVVACGATPEEAQNRLFNERYLSRDQVSSAWWWWRWYYAASAARQPNLTLPRQLLFADLRPLAATRVQPRDLIDKFDLGMSAAGVEARADGSFSVAIDERTAALTADGALEVRLAPPNLGNRMALGISRARRVADETVRRFVLDAGTSLVFDRVRQTYAAGASAEKSGTVEEPRVTETTVQYRQLVNGLPVISPGRGLVSVTLDNDGKVTQVRAATRQVENTISKARSTPPQPPAAEREAEPAPVPAPSGPQDFERLLALEFGKRLNAMVARGGMPVAFETVPGSTEVGYDIAGDTAQLVARKAVEVDFGGGYKKRYWVQAPLFG